MVIHEWKIFPASSLFLLVIKHTFSQASFHGLCQPREAVSGQAGTRVDLPLVRAQDIGQLICHIQNLLTFRTCNFPVGKCEKAHFERCNGPSVFVLNSLCCSSQTGVLEI